MFKFAYNTNGLRNMPLISAVEEVYKYGYDGVEISLHSKHLHPLNIKDNELQILKKIIMSLPIVATNIATGCADLLSNEPYAPSIIDIDPKGRKRRVDLMQKTIEIASYLDIPVVTFATGFKSDDISDEQAIEYLMEGIANCLGHQPGITLALEPEPGMFIEKSSQALELIKKMNEQRLRLNLDIGHVYCCEDNPVEAISQSIPYSSHIHIEDIKNKVHHHEIPGTGDIDFDTLFKKLIELNYQNYLSVELYHHSDVWRQALSESLNYLKDTSKRVLDQYNKKEQFTC